MLPSIKPMKMEILFSKGDECMSKHDNMEAKIQSQLDNLKEARNSKSGFKSTMSAGVQGTGSGITKNNR